MADEGQSTSSEAPSAGNGAAAAESPGGGIKSAAEVIEKVLAKDAAAEPGKGKPAKESRRVEALEAKAAERAELPEAPIDRARAYLQQGDVARALEVFGDLKALGEGLPDAIREQLGQKLGVGSKKWVQFRQAEAASKRAIAAREQELSGIVHRLQEEYAPLHRARELYAAQDYDGAFREAFGEDAAEYNRKVIGQRVGKNPEVEKLRAELEAERQERRQREEAAEQARAEAEQRAAVHDYLNNLQAQCRESEDPTIRRFAQRPQFIQRIYQIQKQSYDARANTCAPLSYAAELARDEILQSLREWSGDDNAGVSPAIAARASAQPAKPTGKPPARNLKQSQAAEANGKPAKLTSEQIRDYHQRLMEQLPADS